MAPRTRILQTEIPREFLTALFQVIFRFECFHCCHIGRGEISCVHRQPFLFANPGEPVGDRKGFQPAALGRYWWGGSSKLQFPKERKEEGGMFSGKPAN